MPSAEITLHGTALSGHAHRVELLYCARSVCPIVSTGPGLRVQRSGAFRKLNPLGQIRCFRTAISRSPTATRSWSIW